MRFPHLRPALTRIRALRGLPRSAFMALAILASPVHAAEPRITSATPTASGWQVTVQGLSTPEFQLDGQPVTAHRSTGGPADGNDWEIPTANSGAASRLVVRQGGRDLLALRLQAESPADAPFDDWSIYHIMLEDFANGDVGNDRAGLRRWVHPNYAGGDLQGVLGKVDYLKSLGVNAVWLSPLFAAETSHGYDVMNYYRVGDAVSVPRDREAAMQLYQKTVAALHAAGIRVILDLPLNHASGNYERREGDPKGLKPKSTSAQQEAEKLWESWNTGWRYWNFDDAGTREFLKDVGAFWLTEGKVDGLRLDYVRGIPHDFWADFYKTMKAAKPDAFLFGEAWSDAAAPGPNAEDMATYFAPVPGHGLQFDGLIGFPMQMVMNEVFARGTGRATELEYWLQHTDALYGAQGRSVNFLDNHDMSRFLAWTDGVHGQDRLVAALGFMASLSSPMAIYYGTESGISGGRAELGFTDSNRIPMPWKSLDTKLIGRVTEILKARAQWPAITRGARLPVYCDDKVLVMRKQHPSGDVLVAVNLGDAERTVQLSATGVASGAWSAVLGTNAPQIAEDGSISWKLPPLSTSWARR